METLSQEFVDAFIEECRENLAEIEDDLTALADGKTQVSLELVNRVFRACHSLKGAAAYLQYDSLRQMGQLTEKVLGQVRDRGLELSSILIGNLLAAVDRMSEMVRDYELRSDVQFGQELESLNAILRQQSNSIVAEVSGGAKTNAVKAAPPISRPLRMLVVEDDFACRVLLQGLLARHGDCHVAVNGKEAVQACVFAKSANKPYDLICMDIQMPEMGGQEAVTQIRSMERAEGRHSNGARIFMTTSVYDMKTIVASFKALCDAYLFKPISGAELEDHLRSFGLVAAPVEKVRVS